MRDVALGDRGHRGSFVRGEFLADNEIVIMFDLAVVQRPEFQQRRTRSFAMVLCGLSGRVRVPVIAQTSRKRAIIWRLSEPFFLELDHA